MWHRVELPTSTFRLLNHERHITNSATEELKIGEFQPEHIGKMQFYLAVLDDTARLKAENPSIGILICKSKDRTIVEYALRESAKPIGVATYRMVSAVPEDMTNDLPNPDTLARLLDES